MFRFVCLYFWIFFLFSMKFSSLFFLEILCNFFPSENLMLWQHQLMLSEMIKSEQSGSFIRIWLCHFLSTKISRIFTYFLSLSFICMFIIYLSIRSLIVPFQPTYHILYSKLWPSEQVHVSSYIECRNSMNLSIRNFGNSVSVPQFTGHLI